jgi:hypothetical protein
MPSATGFARRVEGSEAFRGKSLKDQAEKRPGHELDRLLSPFPSLPRPWDMWLHVVSGDFTDTRALSGSLWGPGNALTQYFGPGSFTWVPGLGGGNFNSPLLEFSPTFPGLGAALTFGTDGRKNDRRDGENTLRGRFAADQNLPQHHQGQRLYRPLAEATRFSLFPMRHHTSDLALSNQITSEYADLRTALNPRLHPAAVLGATVGPESAATLITQRNAGTFEGTHFPGAAFASGVFYQAPMTLLTGNSGTSANAFTVYVVGQSILDKGAPRTNVKNSGPGHLDTDDLVLASHWLRLTVEKIPQSHPARWRTVHIQRWSGMR